MAVNHNILFLHSGSFCYDSDIFFEQCIRTEFERLGWQTESISCLPEKAAPVLQEFYGKSYDIVFDINGILPCVRDMDGEFFLNRIQGQKWHYILDHPFYHDNVLRCSLKDFNVICLDETHAEFIRKHYPHILKVLCLPLASAQAGQLIPYQERGHEVLFTGTYTNSDVILYQMMKQPKEKKEIFERTVQLLLDQPQLTLEEAVSHYVDDENLPGFLKDNYFIDMYLRACLREELLALLLKKDIPVTVYGHNWEDFIEKCRRGIPKAESHLHIIGEVPYAKLPDVYADAKIALNQLPWFKAGMHDRIPMGMMNGCVCITDESLYLTDNFIDGEQLYFYSLENMEQAPEIILELLENPDLAVRTAARGYSYAVANLSWKSWLKSFLQCGEIPF